MQLQHIYAGPEISEIIQEYLFCFTTTTFLLQFYYIFFRENAKQNYRNTAVANTIKGKNYMGGWVLKGN